MRTLALALCLMTATAAAQVTWHVDDNAAADPGPGNPNVSDPLEAGSLAHPFDTIQEAIDAAIAGDTVLVADGSYTGAGNRNLDPAGRDVTIRSANGPAACIIDLGNVAGRRGFHLATGETAACVIEGFTITRGYAFYVDGAADSPGGARGGAIYVANASPTIRNCILEDNRTYAGGDSFDGAGTPAEASGGALYLLNSSSAIRDCVFSNNQADGSVSTFSGDPTGTNPAGAALCAEQSTLTLERCTFVANAVPGGDRGASDRYAGGAVCLIDTDATILDCDFRNNQAAPGGRHGTVHNPFAVPGSNGGALGVYRGSLNMSGCHFSGNRAGAGGDSPDLHQDGGAGGWSGAIHLFDCPAEIEATTIVGSLAGTGGEAFLTGAISGNGGPGGAISAVDADLTMRNCLLAGNASGAAGVQTPPAAGAGSNGQGGAVAAVGAATVTMINCTVADNLIPLLEPTDPELGGGLFGDDTASITLANAIVRGNTPGSFELTGTATLAATYTNIPGVAGTGNMDVDPGFVPSGSPTSPGYLYRPGWGAPGNDAGDNAALPGTSVVDADGFARYADDPNAPDTGVGTAPLIDMGAYEANNDFPACDTLQTYDCDNDGQPDDCSIDCDENGVPDACDIAGEGDCNGNGIPDACDVALGGDCNANGIPDECDIASGAATDCDADGILDACEMQGPLDGHAMHFDGTARLDFANDGDYDIAAGPITIEAWVRPETLSGPRTIVRMQPNNYWLRLVDGQPTFSYNGAASYRYNVDTTLPLGTWTHLAVVHEFGTSNLTAYVNGVQVPGNWDTAPNTGPQTDPLADLLVGDNVISSSGWLGMLDEVRVWTVARTTQQIRGNLRSTVEPDAAGLRALIRFAQLPDPFVVQEAVSPTEATRPSGTTWRDTYGCCLLLPDEADSNNDGLSDFCGTCAGDSDGDGDTDLADLADVLASFGAAGADLPGDFDGDGDVDLNDLATVLGNFGCIGG